MSSESLLIKLGVSGTFWDRRPEYRVSFNGTPIAHAHVQAESGVTEYIEFTAEYSTDHAVLAVELLNKRPTDTVENADKTAIVQDMTLDIVSLEIDDIDMMPLLHKSSEYRPVYPEHYSGEPVLREYVTLGWNGIWSITWTKPFYLWLLEHL
jgi:hypothetical protein